MGFAREVISLHGNRRSPPPPLVATLDKPFRVADLLATVEAVLASTPGGAR